MFLQGVNSGWTQMKWYFLYIFSFQFLLEYSNGQSTRAWNIFFLKKRAFFHRLLFGISYVMLALKLLYSSIWVYCDHNVEHYLLSERKPHVWAGRKVKRVHLLNWLNCFCLLLVFPVLDFFFFLTASAGEQHLLHLTHKHNQQILNI